MTNIFLYRWKWLGELKQDDGGFIMSVEGEEDVRFVSGSFQVLHRYSIQQGRLLRYGDGFLASASP